MYYLSKRLEYVVFWLVNLGFGISSVRISPVFRLNYFNLIRWKLSFQNRYFVSKCIPVVETIAIEVWNEFHYNLDSENCVESEDHCTKLNISCLFAGWSVSKVEGRGFFSRRGCRGRGCNVEGHENVKGRNEKCRGSKIMHGIFITSSSCASGKWLHVSFWSLWSSVRGVTRG